MTIHALTYYPYFFAEGDTFYFVSADEADDVSRYGRGTTQRSTVDRLPDCETYTSPEDYRAAVRSIDDPDDWRSDPVEPWPEAWA